MTQTGASPRFRRASLALVGIMSVLLATLAPALASPRIPAGWKTVSWRGVSFAVPSFWPVYDLAKDPSRCALFDRHAVYLGTQGPDATCPARALGKVDAVQVAPSGAAPSSQAVPGYASEAFGQPMSLAPYSSASHAQVAEIPRAGVAVTATYSTSARAADEILSSLSGSYSGPLPAASSDQTSLGSASKTGAAYASPYAASDFTGSGFDTCSAPSVATMKAWLASPYRALGIYIGGANRACGDGNLSQSWVQSVEAQGWNLAPLYVGLQAPCAFQQGLARIDASKAAGEGKTAADDAVARAQNFGLRKGTPIYLDMEAYNSSIKTCSRAVLSFEQAWTLELHAQGYVSGVYGSLDSTVADLSSQYTNSSYTEPDDLWYAVWDKQADTADYPPQLPSGYWANHQRIHQYMGGHSERYGGASLNIDSNSVDSMLANSGVYGWSVQKQLAFTDRSKTTRIDLTRLDPGDTAWLTVTANNTGSATWYRTGPAPVEVATWNPKYHKSRFATPAWIDPSRPAALVQSSVPPGATGTFGFPIQVPAGGGSFDLTLNLVARGVAWFNDVGLDYHIVVHAPVYAGLASSGAAYASELGTTTFHSIGGTSVGPPAVVTGPDGTVYYIAQAKDHNVWVRTDGVGWAPMSPTGTWCSSPSAWISGSTLTVACQGQFAGLKVGSTTLSPGLLPQILTYKMLGGQLRGGASVAPIGGTLTYFSIQRAAPSGYDVYRRTDSAGWFRLPYVCLNRPAVASNGHMAYFACEGADHHVWWMRNSGGGWTPFRSLGASPQGSFGLAVAPDGLATLFIMTKAHSAAWNSIPNGTSATWHLLSAKVANGVGAGEA